MAHYAFIDSNNVVVNVIVGVDENITQLDNGIEVGGSSEAWERFYESQEWNAGLTCKRTSYNNNIRKQYATIDGTYNSEADVFIKPQPFSSWTLDANHDWQPPTPKPEGNYRWNETELVWVAI